MLVSGRVCLVKVHLDSSLVLKGKSGQKWLKTENEKQNATWRIGFLILETLKPDCLLKSICHHLPSFKCEVASTKMEAKGWGSHGGSYPKVANKHSLFWESASFAQILLGVQFRPGEPNWSDIIYVIRAGVLVVPPRYSYSYSYTYS